MELERISGTLQYPNACEYELPVAIPAQLEDLVQHAPVVGRITFYKRRRFKGNGMNGHNVIESVSVKREESITTRGYIAIGGVISQEAFFQTIEHYLSSLNLAIKELEWHPNYVFRFWIEYSLTATLVRTD